MITIDADSLSFAPTGDPGIFVASCLVTEDEKTFTEIKFRYNPNMKKEDIMKVVTIEYQARQGAPVVAGIRTAAISKLGASAKVFVKETITEKFGEAL